MPVFLSLPAPRYGSIVELGGLGLQMLSSQDDLDQTAGRGLIDTMHVDRKPEPSERDLKSVLCANWRPPGEVRAARPAVLTRGDI